MYVTKDYDVQIRQQHSYSNLSWKICSISDGNWIHRLRKIQTFITLNTTVYITCPFHKVDQYVIFCHLLRLYVVPTSILSSQGSEYFSALNSTSLDHSNYIYWVVKFIRLPFFKISSKLQVIPEIPVFSPTLCPETSLECPFS